MSHSATEAEAGQCPVIAKKPESECRTSPLADNPDHVDQLCSRLDIGEPRPALTAVHGGFHHKMWRLETQRGTYVVKQLSADIDLGDPASAAHYNVTESIAAAFAAQGVAAVCALRRDDAYLQVIDSAGYLVYPWCDAVSD